jgi:hypothetical protein
MEKLCGEIILKKNYWFSSITIFTDSSIIKARTLATDAIVPILKNNVVWLGEPLSNLVTPEKIKKDMAVTISRSDQGNGEVSSFFIGSGFLKPTIKTQNIL